MFRGKAVTVTAVMEVLATRTQVKSSLGGQLARLKDGIAMGGGVSDGENGQALLDQANIFRCVDSLSLQPKAPWAVCDKLPQFAKKVGMAVGRVAVEVVRAYEPWALDVDAHGPAGEGVVGVPRGEARGLAEVYAWMRRVAPGMRPYSEDPKGATQRAALMLADAKIVVAGYVDLWNRKGGFNQWLGVGEFALRYGVPARTVQRWCDEGKLPAVLVRGKYRIDTTEIDEVLEPEAPLATGGRQISRKPSLSELEGDGIRAAYGGDE